MRDTIDIALGESGGNGGDIQKVGNDIGIVYGRENHVYIAFFGGNVEESTPAVDNPNRKAKDFWGNTLLFKNQPIRQYNSKLERTLKGTELSSAARIRILTAAQDDLKFLVDQGVQVSVEVTYPGINTVKISVKCIYTDGEKRLTIITFKKNAVADGDFTILDFNNDFY